MKIRGTPAHIAEKYLTLSRDAQTSGDPVLAENYLQHAEHYMRIIMAYREQLQQPGDMANGNGHRLPGDGGDEFGDDEGEDILDEGFAPQQHSPSPQPQQPHQPHQPQHQARHSGGGYDANRNDRPYRRDQGSFRNRDRGGGDRDRGDRDRGGNDRDRGDRDRGDHRDRPLEGRPPQQDRPAPQERHQEPIEANHEPRREAAHEPRRDGGNEPRRRDRFQQPHEQPEFLRRPVRRSRSSESEEAAPPPVKEEPTRD